MLNEYENEDGEWGITRNSVPPVSVASRGVAWAARAADGATGAERQTDASKRHPAQVASMEELSTALLASCQSGEWGPRRGSGALWQRQSTACDRNHLVRWRVLDHTRGMADRLMEPPGAVAEMRYSDRVGPGFR